MPSTRQDEAADYEGTRRQAMHLDLSTYTDDEIVSGAQGNSSRGRAYEMACQMEADRRTVAWRKAGRPPLGDKPMTPHTLYLTDEQIDYLGTLDTNLSRAIRALIDQHKEDAP